MQVIGIIGEKEYSYYIESGRYAGQQKSLHLNTHAAFPVKLTNASWIFFGFQEVVFWKDYTTVTFILLEDLMLFWWSALGNASYPSHSLDPVFSFRMSLLYEFQLICNELVITLFQFSIWFSCCFHPIAWFTWGKLWFEDQ